MTQWKVPVFAQHQEEGMKCSCGAVGVGASHFLPVRGEIVGRHEWVNKPARREVEAAKDALKIAEEADKAKEAIDNALQTLKSLKIYLQEIEEKANVCWREVESEIQTLEKVRK